MAKHSYDDDVFTLKEDEAGKHRAHVVQYALVCLMAVALITIALWGSIALGNQRLAYQRGIESKGESIASDNQVQETITASEDTNYWPESQFPDIPKLPSNVYDTHITGHRAEINVPMSAAAGYDAYVDKLADEGAQVYVRIPRLTVLAYKGTEIHLISGNGKNAVALCSEPRTAWSESNYARFPLPKKGQLVDVSEGTGEGSRVLTYRLVSASDAVTYCSELTEDAWGVVGTLEPQDHVFACTFKKEYMQISVDYFSGGDNFKVRLDFINT